MSKSSDNAVTGLAGCLSVLAVGFLSLLMTTAPFIIVLSFAYWLFAT